MQTLPRKENLRPARGSAQATDRRCVSTLRFYRGGGLMNAPSPGEATSERWGLSSDVSRTPATPCPAPSPKDGVCPTLGTGNSLPLASNSSGPGQTLSRGQGLVDSGRSSSESLRTMGFLFHANARLETVHFCFEETGPHSQSYFSPSC